MGHCQAQADPAIAECWPHRPKMYVELIKLLLGYISHKRETERIYGFLQKLFYQPECLWRLSILQSGGLGAPSEVVESRPFWQLTSCDRPPWTLNQTSFDCTSKTSLCCENNALKLLCWKLNESQRKKEIHSMNNWWLNYILISTLMHYVLRTSDKQNTTIAIHNFVINTTKTILTNAVNDSHGDYQISCIFD